VPPLACSVVEKATPLVPEDCDGEVTISALAPITIEVAAELVCAGLPLSLTANVKLDLEFPTPVGVPEITPVEAARVSPAGRLPAVTDHV
jgi:hypothetical protein